jgi:hypothetical protein
MKLRIFIFLLFFPLIGSGQNVKNKDVTVQSQSWFACISSFKISDRWVLSADAHMRRNDFLARNSFVIVRGGIGYEIRPSLLGTFGYAHLWLSPSHANWSTIANENRIYQQALYSTKIGNVTVGQRVRNEQRWQDIIVEDHKLDGLRFSNRVRYQLSCFIPISKNKSVPMLVVADEVLLQFGKDIVYNAFDQNRIFVGIRQSISKEWSYDFGYMQVYQQRASGYQYDQNHTLRLFFYYNKGFKEHKNMHHQISGDE